MILHAVIEAAPSLTLIALGVGAIALADRPGPDAHHHDLSDYHQPTAPAVAALVESVELDEPAEPDDILPPAPPGMNAGSPMYADVLFAHWHPSSPADVAAHWLRDLGEQAYAACVNTVNTGAIR